MLVLQVEEIKKKPRDIDFTEPAAMFPALHDAEEAGECVFVAPVTGQLRASWEYDHVRVAGEVHARVRLSCARCLVDFEQEMQVSFIVYYSEATPGMATDEEIELAEQDLLSATYDGSEINVAREIAEQLLMEMPVKPLCDERCRGLCNTCGADLNGEACSCESQDGSLAFSVLKQFNVPRKGE